MFGTAFLHNTNAFSFCLFLLLLLKLLMSAWQHLSHIHFKLQDKTNLILRCYIYRQVLASNGKQRHYIFKTYYYTFKSFMYNI